MADNAGTSPQSALSKNRRNCRRTAGQKSDRGMTLVELLAGIAIASIVLTLVVSLSLYISSQVSTLLSYSKAQRDVLQTSYDLTSILRQSDWVNLTWTPANRPIASATSMTLATYQGGTYQKSDGSPGDYTGGVYSGGTINNGTPRGKIQFVLQSGSSASPGPQWSVHYTDSANSDQDLGTVGLVVKYPTSVQPGVYVNSFVFDLSEPYTTPHGQSLYTLTMGFHDKDLR